MTLGSIILKDMADLFGDLEEKYKFDEDKDIKVNKSSKYIPAYKTYNTDTKYQIDVFLPGFQREEIAVEIIDNKLSIYSTTGQEENSKYYYQFKLDFNIDLKQINTESIESEYSNGVLYLVLEKKVPKTIKIKVM